jgi:hypothetical protein
MIFIRTLLIAYCNAPSDAGKRRMIWYAPRGASFGSAG